MKIRELSNYQIVTIVVALLGGDSEHIDKEDIAIKAYELAANKFSWRKYPDRIDLNTVTYALNDAKKAKNGSLIIGNNFRGWMLSRNGLKWLLSLSRLNEFKEHHFEKLIEKINELLTKEVERLTLTQAYSLFISERREDISEKDFFEFTRTNKYFKIKAKERRFTIVENAIINYPALEETWSFLKTRFLEKE